MSIYKKSYSDYYDTLYKDKNYKGETDFIAKVLNRYSSGRGKNLLSLGCGTCNYELLLAKKGYTITGVDRSVRMLSIAAKKIKSSKIESKINVVEGDVRNFSLDKKFDSCMAMFNIVGYLTEERDFEKMINNVSKNLKKDGLFIFDCWYTPAVLKDKPKNKTIKIKSGHNELTRITKSFLNLKQNTIEINFDVIEREKGKKIGETKETHVVRHWSYPELRYFVTKAGFSLLKVCCFMNLDSEISENVWNIFVIARKQI